MMRIFSFDRVLSIAIILGPWFYLRYGGFDFSVGTSFTLGDAFISLAMMIAAFRYMHEPLPFNGYIRAATALAMAFLFLSLVSATIAAGGFFKMMSFELSRFLSAFGQYAFVMIGFILLGERVNSLQRVIFLVGISYLAPMIVTVFLAIAGELSREGSLFFAVNRAIGSYGNANSFAAVLLLVLPLYIQLWVEGKSRVEKSVGVAGLLLTGMCLFLTVSFSAWIVFTVTIAANVAFMFTSSKHPLRRYRLRVFSWLLIGMSGVALAIVAFLNLFPEIFQALSYRLLLNRDVEVSIEKIGSCAERLDLIRIAIDEVINRWGGVFFGHGLGQSVLFPGFNLGGIQVVVHNLPMLLWLESGLIATLSFYAFFLLLAVSVWRARRDQPVLALTIANSIALFVAYSLFNPHMYLRYFWIPLLPAFVLASSYRPRF